MFPPLFVIFAHTENRELLKAETIKRVEEFSNG